MEVAKKVEQKLEEKGIQVVMTREEDKGESSKRQDMEKRVALINEVDPIMTVSIHQNSYTDAKVKGAQVFYYTNSKEGETAAQIMQEQLKLVDSENIRQIKSDSTFYLLKNTKVPTIIVECGFLSNYEDAEKLVTQEYQNQMAEAITNGILEWIRQQSAVLE